LYNEIEDTAHAQQAQKMISDCDKAIEAGTSYSEGMDCYENGEYEAGKSKFQESQLLYNEIEDTAHAQQAQKMISDCDKAIEAGTSYSEGMDHYENGEYDDAMNKFERAATLYEEIGNSEKAAEARNEREEAKEAKDKRESRNKMLTIGGLIVIGLAIVGIVVKVLLKKPQEEYTPPPKTEKPTQARKPNPLEALKRRLAKGEISPEEYERLKKVLKGEDDTGVYSDDTQVYDDGS
jgi:tetratricopeptide (TPR) repeat protein